MKGYLADIEHLTEENTNFRKVLYTGKHLQLVLMTLKPGESIGRETHATHDQFFRIEEGTGALVIDGVTRVFKDGDGIIVPAGAVHNLTNKGDTPLRLYTIYGPPNHIDALVQATKAEAEASHEVFEGGTTE
ncbi:MAG: cupin domain-containing protein [Paracoccaceae bacterium]